MRRVKILIILAVVFYIFLWSVGWAGEKKIIKFKEGISYLDIDNDGMKDIIINAQFVTPFGGNLYRAYSFYLRTNKGILLYIPIQQNKGSEAVIYTFSKFGGCGGELTNISGLRMIKIGEETYLIFTEKNCGSFEKLFNGKCKFKVDIYKYDSEDKVFVNYKTTVINELYCDANEIFIYKTQYILNLLKEGK